MKIFNVFLSSYIVLITFIIHLREKCKQKHLRGIAVQFQSDKARDIKMIIGEGRGGEGRGGEGRGGEQERSKEGSRKGARREGARMGGGRGRGRGQGGQGQEGE